MPENVSSIICINFFPEVKRMLGEKLTKGIIVYGSYARGDYRDNSA